MEVNFKASKIKVDRARAHIAELESVLADHFAENPPKATFTPATAEQNAHIHVESKTPPDVVGAIVGDIIHNLRAALDLMAVQLVSLSTDNTDGVYFPFCEDESYLGKMIRKRNFDRAGDDAVRLLHTLKPFKGGNIALRALHDLDIQDKHHSLIPNAAMLTTPQVTADTSKWPEVSIRLVEGSVPEVATTFPNDSPLAGQQMVPALHQLVKLVEGILVSFTALVAARA